MFCPLRIGTQSEFARLEFVRLVFVMFAKTKFQFSSIEAAANTRSRWKFK